MKSTNLLNLLCPLLSAWVLLSICALSAYAQQGHELISKSKYVATYQMVYLTDTIEGTKKDDRFMLQIAEDGLSRWVSEYSYRIDSIYTLPDALKIIRAEIREAFSQNKLPNSKRSSEYIYKNYPKGEVTVTDYIVLQDYIYSDQLHPQEWELKDSIQMVQGYECHLASTIFRGREWYAWYAPELPLDNGPWKLGGLPGLILEAYDAHRHYHYSLIGFEEKAVNIYFGLRFDWERNIKQREKVSRIEFLRAKASESLKMSMQMESLGIAWDASNARPFDLLERDYR